MGRQVVQALARQGARVVVAVRRPGQATFVQTMGEVGQVVLLACDITDANRVNALLKDAQAAVNLVGLLFERGSQTFDRIHVQGAHTIAAACRDQGVDRFVHFSALGPEEGSSARYAQTKLTGEKAILKVYPGATLLRPSLIYGPGEKFFSLYARLLQISPVIPLFGGGQTRFQPVYVGDVAQAVVACLKNPKTKGQAYTLAGPEVLTFKDLIDRVAAHLHRRVCYINLPYPLAQALARFLSLLPTPLLTPDQVKMLKTDSICPTSICPTNTTVKTFGDLAIDPVPLRLKLPHLLKSYTPTL